MDYFDPTNKSFLENPYSMFSNFRASKPVTSHGNTRWPMISVFRYSDIEHAFKDTVTWSSDIPEMRDLAIGEAAIVIQSDGARHASERSKIAPLLSGQSVSAFRTVVIEEVHSLLKNALKKRTVNFAEEIAGALSIRLICALTGLSKSFEERIRDWTNQLATVTGAEFMSTDEGIINAQIENVRRLHEELTELYLTSIRPTIAENNSIFGQIASSVQSLDEEIGYFKLLVFAGNHTTSVQLTNLAYLANSVGKNDFLSIKDEFGIRGFIDEGIRYLPVFRVMNRRAITNGEIEGVPFEKGCNLLLWIASANRDSSVFEAGDQFLATRRSTRRNMSFGYGPHVCPGRHLAEIAAQEVFQQIFSTNISMTLLETPKMHLDPWVNAFESLNIEFF